MINYLLYINKIIFLFIIFFNSHLNISQADNAKIILKINDQIITNQDIVNEQKFLIVFNQNLKNLDSEKMYNVAKDSLIKHAVKIQELSRHFILNSETDRLKEVLKDFYIKINVNNEAEKKDFLKNNNIFEKDIKSKLEVEALWNELIYKKYIDQVNIDKEKLRERLINFSNNTEVKSFLLSEILFSANSKDEIRKKYSEILESISINGFENSANIFSTSDSSRFGGKIGWVNENKLSPMIYNVIKNYNVGEFTKPINIPGGLLILKINDIKMEKVEIDIEEELKKLISFEKKKQLDQFSLIYYKKIQANAKINEN